MALQINKALTTKQGFDVPSGSYVWIMFEVGREREYSVRTTLLFYKDKTSLAPFEPVEIPTTFIKQILSPEEIATASYSTLHTGLKAWLESFLGADTVEIVD